MHLIDKDALVAEIERLKADALQKKSQCKRSGLERIMHQIGAYNKIISFLDTLEAKEVDWEKERMSECPYRQVVCTMYEGKMLEVHHNSYEHVGDEKNHLEDLVVLCRDCHAMFHSKRIMP